MKPGRIGCDVAVLAVFCVLTIFLFPALQGPYSAVHGPVTSLQALRSARRFWSSIVQAALASHAPSSLLIFSWMSLSTTDFPATAAPACNPVLRC
jgi:hypothetical protein